MKKILYVHYGDDGLRGSEVCLLNLMQTLDGQHFTPLLWTNNRLLHEKALKLGIPSTLSRFAVLFGWQGQRASLSQYIRQLRLAVSLIRQHNTDLIHVNSGAPCQWMWLAARWCRVPMLTQLHSGYPLRDRLRLCLHLSDHLVSVSRAVSQKLLEEGYPGDRLQVIYNGINIPALQKQPLLDVKQALGIPVQCRVIVSVGALVPTKGMDRVICAVAALRSSHPDLHLLVIGEGPSRAALILLSQQLGIAEQVHFIGQQRMVQSWLRGGIELFVSGAREEAFGLVLAEAALAGIPVIAPKVGGIPEVLLHQDSALLYNSNQPEQMAYQITRLLNDKTEANALAESALQRVRQHFSLTENTRQLTRLYNQLLDNYPQWPPQPGLLSCLKPLKAISLSHLTN